MKCPECGGEGFIPIEMDTGIKRGEKCPVCKGTGELQGYTKKAYSGKLTQLRDKVKSLKMSRDDLIARATELQGKLNGYKTEVEQALDLASFYEKQALENERLADLLKIFIGVMIQAGIDVPDAGKAPDIVHNALRLLKAARSCIQDLYALNEAQSEPMLLEAIDKIFNLKKPKIEVTDLKSEQVTAEDETAIFEPEKGGDEIAE